MPRKRLTDRKKNQNYHGGLATRLVVDNIGKSHGPIEALHYAANVAVQSPGAESRARLVQALAGLSQDEARKADRMKSDWQALPKG